MKQAMQNQTKKITKNTFLLGRIIIFLRRKLSDIFSIQDGTDVQGTIDTIKSGAKLKGTNIWIMICGAMLASLGLDTNSAAVIIGAMLISPLMSPILGIGLAVGINDKDFLISSLKNFGIAVLASLITSFVYFLFTPLGDPTAEITARTSPTLLDVGIAFFGGVAGIVAGSRLKQTNAIPGVAIATALMPPLCTAGFGLATGRISFFFGAFYLFFINAVVISLSTYLIVRFLKFPHAKYVDEKTKKNVMRWIYAFSMIVFIPSGIILYFVIDDIRTKKQIDSFIEKNLESEQAEAIRWEKVKGDSLDFIKVYMVGKPINDEQIAGVNSKLSLAGLMNFRLKLIQMDIPDEERKRLADEAALSVLQTIELNQRKEDLEKAIIDSLKNVISVIKSDSILFLQLNAEIKSIIPEVEN